jgi:hypothetical protein
MVVVDVEDKALQRVGGMQPESGFVGIPSVIVTAAAGRYIEPAISDGGLYAHFTSARDSSVADAWIDLSVTQWAEDSAERVLQMEALVQKYSSSGSGPASASIEIVPWLQRRIDEITSLQRKADEKKEL